MFLFERWQVLIAALQLHRMNGVNLMVIPIISVLREIYDLLKEYESEGVVRLKHAPQIPFFVSIKVFFKVIIWV
jgi:hypothetical protein